MTESRMFEYTFSATDGEKTIEEEGIVCVENFDALYKLLEQTIRLHELEKDGI